MLDKAIKSGKEHRKPYRGSERFDKSCRCNGGCPYCRSNRLHNLTAKILAAEADIKDTLEEEKF
jgi:hypothetical protein